MMAAMEGAENLLDYHFRPPGWIVIQGTPEGLVIRDPDVSLFSALASRWITFTVGVVSLALWWVFPFMDLPILWFATCIVGFLLLLLVFLIWQRWRTPSLLRLGNGLVSLWRRRGAKVSEEQWSAGDIVDIETSFGSPTFHSFYSFRLHLRDGSKATFLHCENSKEGYWLLNYLKMLIANEQGALMVQDVLAPALKISLPPPPLPAMGARVGAMEQQVIKTAPPALPDSQTELTSNQNRA
jgi:hypothetical protein